MQRSSREFRKTARELAHLDAYLSLAKLAIKENYVRPRLSEGGSLFIKEGRHPVVEKLLEEEQFIPNDTSLEENQEIAIITGPNMAGKSTYMRQVVTYRAFIRNRLLCSGKRGGASDLRQNFHPSRSIGRPCAGTIDLYGGNE